MDVRDNIDCIPGGLNLSETCSIAACRAGVFYNIDHTIPHNEGSARRIRVLLRDGCIVGRPRYPVGTSVATTNVTDRLVNAVSCCFAQIGPTHGMAEGGYQQALGLAVISGEDPRRDGQTYVNQMFIGFGGGPGLPGHDGWVTFGGPVDGGMQNPLPPPRWTKACSRSTSSAGSWPSTRWATASGTARPARSPSTAPSRAR